MKIFLILMLFIFSACSKEFYFQRDQEKISKEIKFINVTDQAVRRYIGVIDTKYKLKTFDSAIDSAQIFGELDFAKLVLDEFEPIESQLKKLPPKAAMAYKQEIENSWKLCNQVDSLNLIKFLKIIKKYGYPSYDNRKWNTITLRVGATTLLTHMDVNSEIGKKYFDILIKEHKKGRFDEGSMRQYLWHYNYREGNIDYGTNIDTLVNRAKKIRASRDIAEKQRKQVTNVAK